MTSSDVQRDPIEELAAEFMERQRRGEQPSVGDYMSRHPDLAEEIGQLFPTIAALEGLKQEKPAAPARELPTVAELSYLGDYRILREIGRGGMGIVYEAEQESLGRHVAVKVLPQGPLLKDKQLRRFQREAKTAARLHHTNIVPVFGVGAQDGLHYYVMQFIPGVGLDAVIDALRSPSPAEPDASGRRFSAGQAAQALQRGAFPDAGKSSGAAAWHSNGRATPSSSSRSSAPRRACNTETAPRTGDIQDEPVAPEVAPVRPTALDRTYWHAVAQLGCQVASALEYAHSQNVLHRDIKPANLLVDATGNVWLADFGLARALEEDAVSNPGDVVGTPQYMAPEQFHGKYDARSDICGLGLTLYELLTQQPAYEDSNRFRLFRRITQEQPRRPRTLNRAIPRDLETIVLKALAREPQQRYQTARELHDDLQRYLEDRPILARRTSPVVRLGRWCLRNPAVAGLTALALSLLVTVAVVASIGYVHTRDALAGETSQRQLTSAALAGEKTQRQRAEATVSLSLEVLEEIFERLAPDRVVAASQLTFASEGEGEGEGAEEIEVTLEPTLSPETAALLEKLLVFYDRLAEQGTDDSKIRRQAAKANRRVGDIQRLMGQSTQALVAYRRSVSMYRELANQAPGDATLQTDLAGVHNAIGLALRRSFRAADGRTEHRTAIRILTAPALRNAAQSTVAYELARTYFHLAKTALEMPRQAGPKRSNGIPARDPAKVEAEQNLGKAVQLLRGLADDEPTVPAYRHLLALCYREKSTLHARIDWTDRNETLRLLQQLIVEYPRVPEYRFDLSQTLARLDIRGALSPMLGSEALEKDLQEALRLCRQLVTRHPNVPDYQLTKAQIHHRLGSVQKLTQQLDKAEKNFRQAVDLQSSLAQRFPMVAFHRFQQSRFVDALTDLLLEEKKWNECRPLVEASIADLKKAIGQDEKLRFMKSALGEQYSKLARILRESQEPELAGQAERQAQEIRQSLPKGTPGFPKDRDKKGGPKG